MLACFVRPRTNFEYFGSESKTVSKLNYLAAEAKCLFLFSLSNSQASQHNAATAVLDSSSHVLGDGA